MTAKRSELALFGLRCSLEIGERGGFRIGGGFMGDAHARRLRAGDVAAGQQQIERALRADQFGKQAGGGRREHAELHFRLAEGCLRRDEQQMSGEGQFQPAAETLAAHRHQERHRQFDHAQDQLVQAGEHRGALVGQMLFDAGAETEMRTFGIEQHRAKPVIAECSIRAA